MSCVKVVYEYNIPDCVDIPIYRGGTWVLDIYLTDGSGVAKDITGYTPLMEIRNRDTDALIATPTPTVIDATGGHFQFSLTAGETIALPLAADGVFLKYDNWLVSVGETLAVYTGSILVKKNISVTV